MRQNQSNDIELDLKYAFLRLLLGEKIITSKEFESIWELQKKV